MAKYDVGLKFLLVTLGLGCAQRSGLANIIDSPEIVPSDSRFRQQFKKLGHGDIGQLNQSGTTELRLPDQDIGQPSRDGTVGGGGLYLPMPESGMEPPVPDTRRGYCLDKQSTRLFRGILPMSGDEAIAATVASEISLWFYIPENNAIRAEFSVLGENGQTESLVHYQEFSDISSRQGFVQITLPKNALEFGKKYWWDLTLTCDERDRSTDVYLYGALHRQAISQLELENDPTVITALKNALFATDTVLTLPDRQAIAGALSDSNNPETLSWVSEQLELHYKTLWQRYNDLGLEMDSLLLMPNSSENNNKLAQLSHQRSRIALELAQLSSFFGLWGDTVNLLATYRADYPQAWQFLLNTLFSEDRFWLGENQASEAQNLPIIVENQPEPAKTQRTLRMSDRP